MMASYEILLEQVVVVLLCSAAVVSFSVFVVYSFLFQPSLRCTAL